MPNNDLHIEQLIERNNELENYFRNTIIPQLFVDADLILQKFTPPAMKQFNLSASDEGRSIKDDRTSSCGRKRDNLHQSHFDLGGDYRCHRRARLHGDQNGPGTLVRPALACSVTFQYPHR